MDSDLFIDSSPGEMHQFFKGIAVCKAVAGGLSGFPQSMLWVWWLKRKATPHPHWFGRGFCILPHPRSQWDWFFQGRGGRGLRRPSQGVRTLPSVWEVQGPPWSHTFFFRGSLCWKICVLFMCLPWFQKRKSQRPSPLPRGEGAGTTPSISHFSSAL